MSSAESATLMLTKTQQVAVNKSDSVLASGNELSQEAGSGMGVRDYGSDGITGRGRNNRARRTTTSTQVDQGTAFSHGTVG